MVSNYIFNEIVELYYLLKVLCSIVMVNDIKNDGTLDYHPQINIELEVVNVNLGDLL